MSDTTIATEEPTVERDHGRFRHHKYTWSKPFLSVRHNWEVVGPDGAVHFHVSMTEKYAPSCGLEFHHTREAWRRLYGRKEAAHHRECSVLGEPCWHDGTSLYASERIWPLVQPLLRHGEHEEVFRILEHEYDSHFERGREL